MIGGLIVLGVIVACLSVAWAGRARAAGPVFVHISDVPKVFAQLKQQGSDGSFAAFMFSDHGRSGTENDVNLQFSIEGGKVGLDWVLIAPVNVREEHRGLDFLEAQGAKPRHSTMNGVTYLRAEAGDLVRLCQRIMSELYGVGADRAVELLPEGFEWKP